MKTTDAAKQAAEAVHSATALLIAAGAGMGVDSGLPDFRGAEGFWRAYPPLRSLGLRFEHVANPRWFTVDPTLAWGFYGQRHALYRRTEPHAGFAILQRWAASKADGAFVFTSNVDGQFQRAGFDAERVVECHGSIHHLQCLEGCAPGIWSANGLDLGVDETVLRATRPLPTCAACSALARPNILMFEDGGWDGERTAEQRQRLDTWLEGVLASASARLVVIELGAGTVIATVRARSEFLARLPGATLVRINPREPAAPPGHVSMPLGALEALTQIDHAMGVH